MPETQAQESWEEVSGGSLVTWNEPRVLEGVYQGFPAAKVAGQFGEQYKHSIVTDEARVEFYSPAILERLLADPRIKAGSRIRIVYEGKSEKTSTGRMAKAFTVQVAT